MKKLMLIVLVLSMAVVANSQVSQLLIAVNGVVDPPDSSINIRPSDVLNLQIWSDGQISPGAVALGIGAGSQGPGSLDASKAVLPYGGVAVMMDDVAMAEAMGIKSPFISLELPNNQGILVDFIKFHCDGPGDVTISLVDPDGVVLDQQVIHQIPEPLTIALLGLGGLYLRRRIA